MAGAATVSNRDQLVMRSVTLLITGQIALAAIVIGFVANTWESIDITSHYRAFIVVCGSGAHFLMSLAVGGVSLLVFRRDETKLDAFIAVSTCFVYIYFSLIIQHDGLATLLMDRPWKSVFPLGDWALSFARNESGELAYYLIPTLASSVALVALYIAKLGIGLKKTEVT